MKRILQYLSLAMLATILATSVPKLNAAEGSDLPASPSGTLPIIHIDTKDAEPIVEKEKKIDANLWIEIPEGCEAKEYALGSAEEPVALTIKGRGNSTWTKFDKKPYKLKFEKKTSVLGMPKHKHFALLAGAHSDHVWMGQSVGMELARRIDLGWASRNEPVELILNGDYRGMYFLYESVKIDENRLDIYEQPDGNCDPETVPYGWLVEVDNNDDEFQMRIPYGNGTFRLTYKSPEELSDAQHQWLYDEFSEISAILTGPDPERWVEKIDASSFAKYFIVRELMGDIDGFNGSMYMHRDKKDGAKWKMGPIWDCSYGMERYVDKWLLDDIPEWCTPKLLPQIIRTSTFKEAFIEELNNLSPKLVGMEEWMVALSKKCEAADIANRKRWEEAGATTSAIRAQYFYNIIMRKANWINRNKDLLNGIESVETDLLREPVSTHYFTPSGLRISAPSSAGVYLRVDTYTSGVTRTTKVVSKP